MKRDGKLTEAQQNARAKVRAKARAWMRDNPLCGPVRRALFELFAELLEEDGSFYPGVRWLAWRLGTNPTTITKYMTEFADRGLIVLLDRKGRGGSNRYRLDYERSRELYPDTVTRAQFEALNYPSKFKGEVSNDVEHFDDAEVSNDVEHFEEENAPGDAPKCATSEAEVFNFSARSVQQGLTKGFKENKAGASASADSRTLIAAGPSRLAATRARDGEAENAAQKSGDGDAHSWPHEALKLAKLLNEADQCDARCIALAHRLVAFNSGGLPSPSVDRQTVAERFPYLARMGVTDDEWARAETRARKRYANPSWASLTQCLCNEVGDRLPVAREAEGDKRFFDRRAADDDADAARAAADVIARAQRAAAAQMKGTT